MHDHLKDLFDRAFDDEPVFHESDSARQAMAQGRGIRRRRRAVLIGGSTAAAAVTVMAVLNLVPALASRPPQMASGPQSQTQAALMLIQQTEPECAWSVNDEATDVAIFLNQDVTAPQREAIRVSLGADPIVRDLVFETREDA